MRKYLLFLFLSSVMTVFAQYPGDGYYRVQNVGTGRYIVLVDNRGSINIATTSADLGALKSYEDFDYVVSRPGSVIYAKRHGTATEYTLYSQGADTYSIVSGYLKLLDNGDGSYKAYATNSGLTKYLKDEDDVYNPGLLLTGGKTDVNTDWWIKPISSTDDDNYFGLTPDCAVGDDYFLTFYAAFPFSFYSDGMAAYYVDKIGVADDGFGMAVWKEITDNMKPASTPMIVKCSSSNPAANRLDLLPSSSSTISSNILSGTFFCNDVKSESHRNVVDYDPSTMRILGVTSKGVLGFVTEDANALTYIPANTAYLVVPKGTPEELQLVTDSEYETLMELHAGIESVTYSVDATSAKCGVYTLTGVRLSKDNCLPVNTPAGVYIVGGKKVVVR
ncbi:MAG: hypothetical protein LUC88_01900 [Prevotella sp.]|nr:hypothetical protein [Prevotella sp.]